MKKKIENMKLMRLLMGFAERVTGDHVAAYAAQAGYFIIMSFIPFILCLTTMIRYTPLTYEVVREAIVGFVPQNLQSFILSIVSEVYTRSAAVVPITALIALWSAGKSVQSLTNGLNTIYHVKETRNWLVNRIHAVIYTFLFVVALIGSLLILVLGNSIQEIALVYVPFLGKIMAKIMGARTLLAFAVLFFIFLVFYKVLPNRRATFKSQVPGAFITAVAWSLFSYFFSIYFDFFPSFSNMYGSLAALIAVMLWIYVCMNMILYGAEINAYFEKEFRQAQQSVMEMLNREKEERLSEENRKK